MRIDHAKNPEPVKFHRELEDTFIDWLRTPGSRIAVYRCMAMDSHELGMRRALVVGAGRTLAKAPRQFPDVPGMSLGWKYLLECELTELSDLDEIKWDDTPTPPQVGESVWLTMPRKKVSERGYITYIGPQWATIEFLRRGGSPVVRRRQLDSLELCVTGPKKEGEREWKLRGKPLYLPPKSAKLDATPSPTPP